jgi:hypothetical protein
MLEELLDIFYNDGDPVGYVDGRDIIEKMGLADQKYLDDYDNRRNGMTVYDNTMEIEFFFKGFCYTSRVLEINPGQDIASGTWIDNHYGLRPEWQREIKLRLVLDK